MHVHPVVVELPDDVYERVERTAKGLQQPIDRALVKIVEAGLPSLAKVPAGYRPELEALEEMTDDELWEVAKAEMSGVQQDRLDELLRKNQSEGLSAAEQQELDQLHAEANRLMLRKSYAQVILKWRGHPVPIPAGPGSKRS